MAESLGTLKVVVDAKEADKLMKDLEMMGMTTKKVFGGKMGQAGGPTTMVEASGTVAATEKAIAGLVKPGAAFVASQEGITASSKSLGDKLRGAFTSKNMKDINKSLFMLQMSSLGVAFSFASIINSVMGLFTGLSDLGTMISTGAMGTAFAGIATGGTNTTNIAATMGVTPEMQTAAWAGFTAIVSQFKAVFDALAVKVLTPEMVVAILAVIDALAITLARPEVAKSIQEIVKAVIEIALAIIPLLPIIADLIVWLGETGLLKLLLLIIVAAEILLPSLAYIQFAFTALMTVGELLGAILGLGIISFGWLLVVIGAVIFLVVFLANVFTNLSNGMSIMDSVTNAFGQTIAQFINLLIGLINPVLSFLGQKKIESWSTLSGSEASQINKANSVVNNITFANAVDLSSKKTVTKTATQIANSSMG